MAKSADSIFAEQVLALFKGYEQELTVSVKKQSENHLDVEVRIPQLGNVGFHVVVASSSRSHSEPDPDPRGFGDTQETTRNAMRDWYPGKMNNWTEHKRVITIEAWNLPDEKVSNYAATYSYDPTSCYSEYYEGYYPDQIYKLLDTIQRTQEYRRKDEQEQQYADRLTGAFARLKRR